MSAQAFRRLTTWSLTFHKPISQLYHPNDSWGLEGPLKHFRTGDLSGRLFCVQALGGYGQPPLQYLTLSGDNGGSQPALGVNTQIAEGMAWSSRQNAMTSKAKPVPGAWMLAWNQGF